METYKFIDKNLKLHIHSLVTSNGTNYYMLFIYNDNLNKFITSEDVINACKNNDDSIIIMIYYFLIEKIKTNKIILFRPVITINNVDTKGHDCSLNAPFYIYISTMNIPTTSVAQIKEDYNKLKNDFTHTEICNGRFELVSKKGFSTKYNNEFITPVSVNNDIHNYIEPYQNITTLLNLESYLIFKKLLNCIYTLIENSANKDNYIIHFSGVILSILHCKIKSFDELKTRLSKDLGLISLIDQEQFFNNYNICITEINNTKQNYTLKKLLNYKTNDFAELSNFIKQFIVNNNINLIDTDNDIPVYYLLFKYILTNYNDISYLICFNIIKYCEFQTYNNIDLFTYLLSNNLINFDLTHIIKLALLILNNIKYMHPSKIITNINYLLTLKNIPTDIFSKLLYIYSINTQIDNINILTLQDSLPNFNELLYIYITYFGFLQEPINNLYKHFKKQQTLIIKLFDDSIKLLSEATHDLYKVNNIVELNFDPTKKYKILNIYRLKNKYYSDVILKIKSVDDTVYKNEYLQFVTTDKCKPVV